LATLITGFVAIGAAFVVLVASCVGEGGSSGRARATDTSASSAAPVLKLAGEGGTASSMAIAEAAAAPAPVAAAANSNAVNGVALAPPSHSASPPARSSTSPPPTLRTSAAPSRSATLVVIGSPCSRAGTVARATTGRYAVCWSGADRVLKWYSL
jgi:hypothetical protein